MAQSDWVDDADEGEWVDDGASQGPGALESLGRGAAQGASLGFADEIAGLVDAAKEGFSDLKFNPTANPFTPEAMKRQEEINAAYKRGRNESRENYKKAQESNPGWYTGGEVGGALATSFVPGMGGSSIPKLAAIGAATGAGSSEADLTEGEYGRFLGDTAMGGALGAGLGYGGEAVSKYGSKLLNSVGEKSGSLAKKLAAKAIGAERGSSKKLGIDKVDDIGEYALENLLSPLASTDDMMAKNAAMEAKGGKMMGDVFDQIDDAGASSFSPRQVAEEVESELGDFYRSPINRGESNQLDNTLESIMMREGSATDSIPLSEAQKLKQEISKVANWKNNINITDKEKMARDTYGIVNRSIDDAAQAGAEATGSVGLLDDLRAGKELYGNAQGADKFLTNKKAAENNNLMSLSDWAVTGLGGGATLANGGDSNTALGTAGLLLTKKGLQKYGPQNAALLAKKISEKLLQNPKIAEVAKKNPRVLQAMVNQVTSKINPEVMLPKVAEGEDRSARNFESSYGKDAILQKTQGSKYAQVMQNAAQSGDQSVAAAHFVLQQRDPEYRKLIGEGDQDERR